MKSILTFLAVALISTTAMGFQTIVPTGDAGSQIETEENATKLSEKDQLRATVQGICPVSGEELGSMGSPIKVQAGQQELFLCCEGCKGKRLEPEHWKVVKMNLAKAQQVCPIMGKPVNADMKTTIVDGQLVFVCCPPCIEKIKADPETAMSIIHTNYNDHVTEKQLARDNQLQAAAQQICPVSGEKLGAMGTPIKVKVGPEETAFLCCQACIGEKIDAGHWKTVQDNLSKAQAKCPVTGKPLDGNSIPTVVDGRKIFACCSDCVEKIKASPAEFKSKVNSLIETNVVPTTQDEERSKSSAPDK